MASRSSRRRRSALMWEERHQYRNEVSKQIFLLLKVRYCEQRSCFKPLKRFYETALRCKLCQANSPLPTLLYTSSLPYRITIRFDFQFCKCVSCCACRWNYQVLLTICIGFISLNFGSKFVTVEKLLKIVR